MGPYLEMGLCRYNSKVTDESYWIEVGGQPFSSGGHLYKRKQRHRQILRGMPCEHEVRDWTATPRIAGQTRSLEEASMALLTP